MSVARELKEKYSTRFSSFLTTMSKKMQMHLEVIIKDCSHIDQIRVRPKSVDRFCKKAATKELGKLKYSDPLNQIQDQLGARIVVYYLEDLKKVSKIIEKNYRAIEQKDIIPDSEKEFGYESKHYILFLPPEVLPSMGSGDFPRVFELQICTLFQHAWSEAEHDIGYKPNGELSSEKRRKLSFLAAQAWGADKILQELIDSLPKTKSRKSS